MDIGSLFPDDERRSGPPRRRTDVGLPQEAPPVSTDPPAEKPVPPSKSEGRAAPEERARYVVKMLEFFIRDRRSKTLGGMSFNEWQGLAQREVIEAIEDAEASFHQYDRTLDRVIIVIAAAVTTIGFWGAVISLDDARYHLGAWIILAAGLVLFATVFGWFGLRAARRYKDRRRTNIWGRSIDIDRKIRKLEYLLEAREKALKKEVEQKFGRKRAGSLLSKEASDVFAEFLDRF